MTGGSAVRAVVIGYPVAQSLSPAIHRAAFREAGRAGSFDAVECDRGQLESVVQELRAERVIGFSVTMPLKEAIVPLCDSLDTLASAVGAVNCVSFEDGRMVGHNTDGEGCCDAIENEAGLRLDGANAVVLGAGGTSRALCVSLVARGADVTIVNRTAERAEEVVHLVRRFDEDAHIRVGNHSSVRAAEVIVNTTSVGMGTRDVPCDPESIAPGSVVVDAVYSPLRTALLEAAARRGARCIDGLWMLVHQAQRQQEIWFSFVPTSDTMRGAALKELAARRQ